MTDEPAPGEAPEIENSGEKPAKPSKRGGLAVGVAAVGIGSAAVAAALLYVRHRKRGRGSA